MARAEDCRYAKSHEWVHVEGGLARVGISEYAQGELGDIVYVNPGEVGRKVSAGREFGVIESVKTASDLYAPVSGEIVEINAGLDAAPETVGKEPLGAGWIAVIKMSNPSEVDALLDWSAYQKFLAEAAH
jgi:glycine cleavage system H protein